MGGALSADQVEALTVAIRAVVVQVLTLASAPPAPMADLYFTADKAIRERTGHSARSLCEAACSGALEASKAGRGWKFTAAALAAWEAARVDGRGRRTRTPAPTPQAANDAEASRARLAAVGGRARRTG